MCPCSASHLQAQGTQPCVLAMGTYGGAPVTKSDEHSRSPYAWSWTSPGKGFEDLGETVRPVGVSVFLDLRGFLLESAMKAPGIVAQESSKRMRQV